MAGSAPGQAGQEQGWAAFDALPQPILDAASAAAPAQAAANPAPPGAAAASAARSPGAGGFSGWQAFESDAPLLPVPAATVVVADPPPPPDAARGSLIMKELPSVSTLSWLLALAHGVLGKQTMRSNAKLCRHAREFIVIRE